MVQQLSWSNISEAGDVSEIIWYGSVCMCQARLNLDAKLNFNFFHKVTPTCALNTFILSVLLLWSANEKIY